MNFIPDATDTNLVLRRMWCSPSVLFLPLIVLILGDRYCLKRANVPHNNAFQLDIRSLEPRFSFNNYNVTMMDHKIMIQ
ncbi:hypothetical protein BDV39DRAFT_59645 [Aspergillus sergii]|uniref:Uncharacterized protein n=1 Tax=Aspergillus sergii TaxID=1034303 RepID=A0A5N6X7X6_9EURO|nr:hypothetical protein BDV39DRAFT_59645 [Aspergillus sergii]